MAYSTKQQQAVLHCLEARREDTLTANDLAEELRRSGSPVEPQPAVVRTVPSFC